MGDKEAHEISSILKRKCSDVRDLPLPVHEQQPDLICTKAMSEMQQADKEDDEDDHGEGSAVRRQSVTFTTSSNEPCLDRRKLQRTPTPFHEILMADGEKVPESPAGVPSIEPGEPQISSSAARPPTS